MRMLLLKLREEGYWDQICANATGKGYDPTEGVKITQLGRDNRRVRTSTTERICLYKTRTKGYASYPVGMTPDGLPNKGQKGKSML